MVPAVEAIEKAELHLHSEGLLSPALLEELRHAGLETTLDVPALAAVCPATSKADWLERYSEVTRAAGDSPVIAAGLLPRHLRDLAAQRVTYVEVMVSGMLFAMPDPGGVVEIFRALRHAASQAVASLNIRAELLIGVGYRTADRFTAQVERILAIRKAGLIRGIAIAGEEPRPSLAASAHDLDRLRDAGLGIEIHAGEWAGPESVRDALEHGRPDRIGHGIAIFRDEALLDEVRRRDLHVEFCPTSNVITGAVARIADHPIRRARELGMNYSVSTDDPAPFGCTMNSEYALLVREFGFGPDDFAAIHRNALRSSFADR